MLASLARELAWNGMDLARAARFADAAIATARAAGDRATLAACLLARHNAGWGPQNAADRLALAGQVAELAGQGRDLELLAEARLLRTTDLLELGDPAFALGLLAAALDRPEEARAHFEHALAVHERLGARTWAARSRDRLAGDRRPTGAPASGGVFRRDGALWTLGYAGRTVRMRDAKGLRDLATLLGAPGLPVHAADLVAAAAGEDTVPADLRLGADEVLDDRARGELRARLLDLEEEVEEADRWHDQERAARAVMERDALVAELAAAAGLGGRARRLGDQSERARKTVTARIRDVLDRIERVHPALGAHLRASVTTGTYCSYSPPAPTAWEL